MRQLFNATVWASDGVPSDARRFRNIFRIVLPLTDALFIRFGVVGVRDGLHLVSDGDMHQYGLWWPVCLVLASLASLIGVVFPKLWSLELVGRICMVGLVAGYAAVGVANIFTDANQNALVGLIIILILLQAWRVGDLGLVAWEHGHGVRT